VVVVFLFVSAGTELLGGFAELAAPQLDPTYNDPDSLSTVALSVAGLGLIALVSFLTSAILFLVWIHRANANARALGALGMEFTPGWCVGWWFIPIANLFKPYQAMREIYQASDPKQDNETWAASVVPSFLGAWWATWIVGNILGQIQARSIDADPGVYGGLAVTSGLLSMLGAALAAKIVRSIHARQEVRARGGSEAQVAGARPPLLA
jgi:hypothetical protein